MRRDEAAFTLIEIVLCVLILGIVGVVVAEAMIVGFKTTNSTDQRLRESVDGQLVTAYFGRDVQAASQIAQSATSPCSSSTAIVTFKWTDPVDGTTAKAAAYVVAAAPPAGEEERLLTRQYCENGVLKTSNSLARYLAATGTPVSVSCSAPCTSVPAPTTVSMALTDAHGYTYTVSGTRRSS